MKTTQNIILTIRYNHYLVPDNLDWTYEDIREFYRRTLDLIPCDYEGNPLRDNQKNRKIKVTVTTIRTNDTTDTK
jgi:hypothetical protein